MIRNTESWMDKAFFWLRKPRTPHGASAAIWFMFVFDLLDELPQQVHCSQTPDSPRNVPLDRKNHSPNSLLSEKQTQIVLLEEQTLHAAYRSSWRIIMQNNDIGHFRAFSPDWRSHAKSCLLWFHTHVHESRSYKQSQRTDASRWVWWTL